MFKAYAILACVAVFQEINKEYDTSVPYNSGSVCLSLLRISIYGLVVGISTYIGYRSVPILSPEECQVALVLFFLSIAKKP